MNAFSFSLCLFLLLPAIYLFLSRFWEKRLSQRQCYLLDRLFLLFFLLPFLPKPSLINLPAASAPTSAIETAASSILVPMADYVLPVRATSSAPSLLFVLWTVGAVVCLVRLLFGAFRLWRIRTQAKPVTDGPLLSLFSRCLLLLGIRSHVALLTAETKSPLSFGLFSPVVLIPSSHLSWEEESLSYVLLHEAQHQKQKDALWNWLLCLLRVVFWFHPVWPFLGRSMHLHREMACDEAVLAHLSRPKQLAYGHVLVRCAVSSAHQALVSPWGGKENVLAKRISSIAHPLRPHSKKPWVAALLSLCLLLTAALPTLALAHPLLPKGAKELPAHQALDAASFFGNYEGSFVLYDMEKDRYFVYGEKDAATASIPASTYKPFSALLALETGVISSTESTLLWDGSPQPFAAWQQDQTLQTAMAQSVNWYFQQLDEAVGSTALSQWFSAIGYGNGQVGKNLDTYWLDGTLQISPLEQAQLMAKLSANQLPCSTSAQETVKNAMLLFNDGQTKLYGKTGSIRSDTEEGLFVGFLTTPSGSYSFAAHIKGPGATGSDAVQITNQLLEKFF